MHPFEDLVVPQKAIGIHWFGQSSFALKDPEGTIVQVDPYFPRERPSSQFVRPRPPLDEAALRTEGVLLTHDHLDHTFAESLGRINAAFPGVRSIGPKESAQRLREMGVPEARITTVKAGDQVAVGRMKAQVFWSRPPEGLPQDDIPVPDVDHLAYVVDTGAVRVFITGDLARTFGDHESLLAPIRALGPDIGLLSTQPGGGGEFPTFEGSVRIAVELGLKHAMPAHYGCFVGTDWDPQEWAAHLPASGPRPLIIPYNQAVVYRPEAA